jgi:hypothetical protein
VKSPKQDALCWLVGRGFAILRVLQEAAATASAAWLLEHREHFRHGFALAALLHRVHGSIVEPDFVENDITFINFAIPDYLRAVGAGVDPAIVKRFVLLYDAVPEAMRKLLTWHPTQAHRQVAARVEY